MYILKSYFASYNYPGVCPDKMCSRPGWEAQYISKNTPRLWRLSAVNCLFKLVQIPNRNKLLENKYELSGILWIDSAGPPVSILLGLFQQPDTSQESLVTPLNLVRLKVTYCGHINHLHLAHLVQQYHQPFSTFPSKFSLLSLNMMIEPISSNWARWMLSTIIWLD